MSGWSPLARAVRRPRRPRSRGVPAWGICLHTTGESLSRIAWHNKESPLALAERIYTNPANYFPHYVTHGGEHLQVCDEDGWAEHVGRIIEGVDRREQYMSGDWLRIVPADVVARWRFAWPGRAHPYSLFPSKSPNQDLIGVEQPPIFPTPARGLRFTDADHEGAAQLCVDIARRNGFPPGWWGPRLLTHEAVGLIDRHDHRGGWDPGELRAEPYYDMPRVRERCRELWSS